MRHGWMDYEEILGISYKPMSILGTLCGLMEANVMCRSRNHATASALLTTVRECEKLMTKYFVSDQRREPNQAIFPFLPSLPVSPK
jgi:hypothetical protein